MTREVDAAYRALVSPQFAGLFPGLGNSRIFHSSFFFPNPQTGGDLTKFQTVRKERWNFRLLHLPRPDVTAGSPHELQTTLDKKSHNRNLAKGGAGQYFGQLPCPGLFVAHGPFANTKDDRDG
jgi:hypothetical protein